MILGGLWFGEHKPVMTTFLQPFKEALSPLQNEGIYLYIYDYKWFRNIFCILTGWFNFRESVTVN